MKDLNLIPKSYYLKKRKNEKRRIKILTAFLLSIVVVSVIIFPMYYKLNLQKQIDRIQNEVEETTGYKINQQKLDDINQKLAILEKEADKLSKNTFSSIKLIDKIRDSIPKKLFITDLSITNKNDGTVVINLVGNSSTEDDIVAFLYHLRKDDFFDNIYISSIQKIQTESAVKTPSASAPNSLSVKTNNKTNAKVKPKNNKLSVKSAANKNLTNTINKNLESYNFDMSMNFIIK
ncbi:MAG: PilN domain-containing protein [Bacillota bacterium]|nr:PilN domain-containing protein [Bacillota bacterium]